MFLINNKCRGDSGPEAKLRQPILNHQHICFISVKKKKEKKKKKGFTELRAEMANLLRTKNNMGTQWPTPT